ncbi:hypothetical protein Q4543_17695 [Salipiger sp. 1_MG-2023]|uniref:hypothetical protein n=1 Tax=Salipiger sp. 1_MG-2023 TaxID=3062665 RepID=UPI0026E4179C|nr:hypothetical protein [Salipiger sp. 1_MG-2023]MDO6587349.1 hypothetical protein [Salipiger sp. 1_MG-2023]
MSGWYAVKRGTLEHEMFAPVGKWSRFEAWSWMIESAAYKPTTIDLAGSPHVVPRGALCFSLRFLADKWQWSVKSVRGFLEKLERHGAVEIQTVTVRNKRGTARTQVSLCNYEKYQTAGHSSGTAGAQQGHKEEQVTNIPVGTGASAPIDPAKMVFDAGVNLLGDAGIQQGKARGIIGKWRKTHSDEALIAAFGRCQREGAVDPVAYIAGALRFQGQQQERRKSHPEIGETRDFHGVTKRYAGNGVGWVVEHA